ncbi:efflux RND transporter periplasmic adaptor subunit [Zhongshania aquimaris]|uniref:Efflux RND transporter periplasmic adaptor subunit n=1 Tax=Zhongshania aquimaris TaxID=2857107 RepID=A0ABS6VT10_9GAMM|nr:efflux RND transporter periplasmic adaptor subunit [Zhongshania aquimaris]MBW2941463.1 efflux RND transporter periplasmic adaptor subunit [Zhongshania aquimaris]
MKNALCLLFSIFFLFPQLTLASATHAQGAQEGDATPHHEESGTQIKEAMAAELGIRTSTVGPQTLQKSVLSFGRLMSSAEQSSHIRARFPGVIRSVAINIGDTVNTGDLLALVESNESLKTYEIKAPINGIIVQRHANAGEMTQDQILFSILSTESLWAELRIFPSQLLHVRHGQAVSIQLGERQVNTLISQLLPADDGEPYILARAKVDNQNGNWLPGMMVEGEIVIADFMAELAVNKSALQIINGETGIFVKEHEGYLFTPVHLGESDRQYTEIRSGVEAGAEYVFENSYLIKADIEKTESTHEH